MLAILLFILASVGFAAILVKFTDILIDKLGITYGIITIISAMLSGILLALYYD